jgi:putative toxin-antitoxin system antitoxin component (TIGR02293 family)
MHELQFRQHDNKAHILAEAQGYLKTLLESEDVQYGDYIDKIRCVRNGLLLSTVLSWVKAGFIKEDLFHELIISKQSLDDRERNLITRLTPQESDTALRAAEMLSYSMVMFKGQDSAIEFLNTPCKQLSDQIPIKLIDTQAGYEYVITRLINNELEYRGNANAA